MSAEWRLLASRQRRWYVGLVAAAVLVALGAGRLAGPWSALLGAAALFTALRAGVSTRRRGLVGFAVRDGQWRVLWSEHSEPVELVGWHFPWRRVGLLYFALPSGRCLRVPLFPDSLPEEGFRRLLVALP